MDKKILVLAAALVILLIALAGMVFAMPSWHEKNLGWAGPRFNSTDNMTPPRGCEFNSSPEFNSTGNFTRLPSTEFGFGRFDCNMTRHNETMNWTGQEFNSTQIEEFNQALEAGDYQTAKQLHETYGFGVPLFDKLNETTFAKYSQIYKLSSELRQELGMPSQPSITPEFGGPVADPGFGFAHDMRHRSHRIDQTPIQ